MSTAGPVTASPGLLGRLRRALGLETAPAAPTAPEEPLALGVNAILCVCDEEWCFCGNLVPMPIRELQLRELGIGIGLGNNPCPSCRAGQHVWSPPATT